MLFNWLLPVSDSHRSQPLPYDHRFYASLASCILWGISQQFIIIGVIQRSLKLLLISTAWSNFTGAPQFLSTISAIAVSVVCLVAWQSTAHLAIVALCVGSVLAWDNVMHPNLWTAGIVHVTVIAMLYRQNGIDFLANMWQSLIGSGDLPQLAGQ